MSWRPSVAGLANRAYLAWATAARARFERAVRDPERAQREALGRILARNAGTAFGRAHGLHESMTVAAFRERVAPRDHDAFVGDVARIAAGERGVLTADPVRCLEPTSGSSGASKLVPYTASLLGEFSAATTPWIHDLLRHRPALRDGRAYWAVTPPARAASVTAGGIPIGMEHDSDYFPAVARALLDRVLGTPRALARAPSVDACRYLTLRALLALPDLAFISVWSPSFLTLLARALDDDFPALLGDLASGGLSVDLEPGLRRDLERALPAQPARAAALRRAFGSRAPEDLGRVWPRLDLVSCWTDGHAGRALAPMRERFPRVAVQAKGLLATEGVVSVPMHAAGGAVAAVGSHFLEFVSEGGEALGAHEVVEGATYEVLLTTSGGFYRYRLKDLVRVDGWYHRAPVLSFVGRADRASDLAGEKLTPAFAELSLGSATGALALRPRFAMLAPSWEPEPHYALYAECAPADVDRLAAAVEERLRESHHYALCRALGQLGPVRAVQVVDGERAYERVCVARGQRAGAIKPAALDDRTDWDHAFGIDTTVEVSA